MKKIFVFLLSIVAGGGFIGWMESLKLIAETIKEQGDLFSSPATMAAMIFLVFFPVIGVLIFDTVRMRRERR